MQLKIKLILATKLTKNGFHSLINKRLYHLDKIWVRNTYNVLQHSFNRIIKKLVQINAVFLLSYIGYTIE